MLLGGCGLRETPRRLPDGSRLIQKREYQAHYGRDGKLQRLLYDADHDALAEAVILYRPNGKPALGEIDSDRDGVIDRWETFRVDGTLESIATATRPGGPPAVWERYDRLGGFVEREFDDDGDGTIDRAEEPAAQPVTP